MRSANISADILGDFTTTYNMGCFFEKCLELNGDEFLKCRILTALAVHTWESKPEY